MRRRRGDIGSCTRGTLKTRLARANQTEEERALENERNRQRTALKRSKETAEQREARIEKTRLRMRELRSRSQQKKLNRLRMAEGHQRETTDKRQTRLPAQQSHNYNRLAFPYNPAEICSYCEITLLRNVSDKPNTMETIAKEKDNEEVRDEPNTMETIAKEKDNEEEELAPPVSVFVKQEVVEQIEEELAPPASVFNEQEVVEQMEEELAHPVSVFVKEEVVEHIEDSAAFCSSDFIKNSASSGGECIADDTINELQPPGGGAGGESLGLKSYGLRNNAFQNGLAHALKEILRKDFKQNKRKKYTRKN